MNASCISIFTSPSRRSATAPKGIGNAISTCCSGVVETEDFPTGETIQFGFASGAQDHVTYGRNEPSLAHFETAVSQALAAG